MKKLILLAFSLAALSPVQAQLFTPESLTGAALGGLAGGLLGGRHAGEAAAIGAGSGFVLGSLLHESRPEPYSYYSSYGYYPGPVYEAYRYSRPNYAWTGAALGGIAGGIIGHNNGRRTGEGIAIGAGAGLLLGSL